ncbi:hypothetical protein BGX26_009265, partial [Mortierella sp. AD094]
MVNAVQGHLLHQQRPLYLQPVDEDGHYPWMESENAEHAEDEVNQSIEETSVSCSSTSTYVNLQVDENGPRPWTETETEIIWRAGDSMDTEDDGGQVLEAGNSSASTSNCTPENVQASSHKASKRKTSEEEDQM